ncbi:MAG: allophanate hydrolase [Desulfobacteraceae bacterium 4484_190.2]|nr:MAG: allophanate hydrolase [Desulfobacteraceae bacterium 4484_190.2]
MHSGLFERAFFRIAGDQGLLVEYGDEINLEVNTKVRTMAIIMKQYTPKGVIETIPTYRSLLIVYDPSITNLAKLQKELQRLEERLYEIQIPPPDTIEIPVCYGGEFGPDIEFVAETHDLSVKEVIQLHSEPEYLIYMVGFTPGFPFLGGLSEKLHTSRLETPRTFVPKGSVGIANNQTGIYPVSSPGGWQLIGRSPIKLFAPERPNPFLYQAGDHIKFKPITLEEYSRLDKEDEK